MKHILYDKVTYKIVAAIQCSESSALLQETETNGILVGIPCPPNPEQYQVINNQLVPD
jgi:hypothetical protein